MAWKKKVIFRGNTLPKAFKNKEREYLPVVWARERVSQSCFRESPETMGELIWEKKKR